MKLDIDTANLIWRLMRELCVFELGAYGSVSKAMEQNPGLTESILAGGDALNEAGFPLPPLYEKFLKTYRRAVADKSKVLQRFGVDAETKH